MRNFKMILEYDGAAYCGWQRQDNGLSIQEVLEKIIGMITGEKITVIGSGRTDAGVHALNQVASFKSKTSLPAKILYRGINGLLPSDIAVKELTETTSEFHAQHDARGKIYIYRIYNSRLRRPLGRQHFWHINYPLDLAEMEKACQYLIGRHDFSCFCATGSHVKDRVRTITDIKLQKNENNILEITVAAEGFLRYMVRNIVGTLVEIGGGKYPPEEIIKIIDSGDRSCAGVTAPAQGLFLKEVKY
jgi:tRNA pseudouridine38-40 synthase